MIKHLVALLVAISVSALSVKGQEVLFSYRTFPVFRGGENVYISARTNDRAIALTFDDGPHGEYTEKIIAILKEYNIPATFFVIGKNAELYPDVLRLEAGCGFEIGNHTYSHHSLCKQNEKSIEDEIRKNSDTILEICGVKTCLFRPPEGVCPERVRQAACNSGYPIILWSVDTGDWRGIGSEKIIKTVKDNVKPGSVILFHDYVSGKSGTPDALRALIPYLIDEGYTFSTVSGLFGIENQ